MKPAEYAQLLYDVLCDMPEDEREKIFKKFAEILRKEKVNYIAGAIMREFAKIEQNAQTQNLTYISSASELSGEQKESLKKVFPEPTEFDVNKKLLAGIAIRRKDILYNHTLRKRLEVLKLSL